MEQVEIELISENVSVAGGEFTVVDAESNKKIASIKSVLTSKGRRIGTNEEKTHILSHRGFDVRYEVDGNIRDVCVKIAAAMPLCFQEAGFGKRLENGSDEDLWDCFNFLRALDEQGGWYGNTPVVLIKKIKACWKKGFEVAI